MVQRGSRWELILSWLYVVLIRRFTFLSLFSASSRPNGHSLSSTDKQKIDTEITQLHDDPLMTSPTDPQAAATTKTSAAETDQAARDLQGPVDEPSTKAVAQDETVALTNETNPTSADHNTTTAVTTGMPTLSTTSTPANSHPPRVLPPVPAPVPDQTPPLVHRSTTRQRQLASRQTMPSFIQPSGSNHHGSSLAQSGGGHRRTVSAISGLGSRDAHRDPLLLAVRRQQPLAVHKLLKTSSGSKEMMYHAITCGRTDEREEGYNLLHYAVSSRCPEILHTLLEGLPEYMRPSAADSHGDTANLYTPLHLAAQKNEYMCASYLLQHQANPNTASKLGLTPLHISVGQNNIQIASLLLDQGANPNAVTRIGNLPLTYAVHRKSKDLIKLLISHGADPNLCVSDRPTAMEVAGSLNAIELVDLMKGIVS